MIKSISNAELRARFVGHKEFALIDVREVGDFSRGHLLAASNLPLSRLELLIDKTIPCRATEIVLADRSTAIRATEQLHGLGYQNIISLEGGLSGWALGGGKLFSGVNVIGKAFGEYIEKNRHTPAMSAATLKALLESDNPPLLLDTRTPEEHSDFCIPGALGCPNGELVFRALAKIESDEQLIVTHCAGRTRSIIGAQALIDAGIPNQVIALENGTLAWQFEDYELELGAHRPLPPPGIDGVESALAAAAHLRQRFSVPSTDLNTLKQWRERVDPMTLYVIDVRSTEEFERGTLTGARHVAGGQLVQNVDEYLVTRNAHTILLDSDGVRATSTAAWLLQLGVQNVYTLTVETGKLDDKLNEELTPLQLPLVDPAATQSRLEQGEVLVCDIRRSIDYRRSHIEGSWFLTRADIEDALLRMPPALDIALVADDRRYGALVAADLERLGRRVNLLDGGFSAWQRTGLPVTSGCELYASEPNDMMFDAGDFDDQAVNFREGRAYLEWEIGLVHQLANDPGAPYAN